VKFYRLALFIFIFNLTLTFVSTSFTNLAYSRPGETWNIPQNLTYQPNPAFSFFGDFVWALGVFLDAFAKATVLLPAFLASFGLPASFVAIFTGAAWFIYIAAIIQFVSGRYME
jgi:hypothetical protein